VRQECIGRKKCQKARTDPNGSCDILLPEKAEIVMELRPDPGLQKRIEELAAKSTKPS
jgi:hypothetical protein